MTKKEEVEKKTARAKVLLGQGKKIAEVQQAMITEFGSMLSSRIIATLKGKTPAKAASTKGRNPEYTKRKKLVARARKLSAEGQTPKQIASATKLTVAEVKEIISAVPPAKVAAKPKPRSKPQSKKAKARAKAVSAKPKLDLEEIAGKVVHGIEVACKSELKQTITRGKEIELVFENDKDDGFMFRARTADDFEGDEDDLRDAGLSGDDENEEVEDDDFPVFIGRAKALDVARSVAGGKVDVQIQDSEKGMWSIYLAKKSSPSRNK